VLYCIFIDETAGKRKHKQADILYSVVKTFKRRFLEIVSIWEIEQDNPQASGDEMPAISSS